MNEDYDYHSVTNMMIKFDREEIYQDLLEIITRQLNHDYGITEEKVPEKPKEPNYECRAIRL